MKTLKLWIVLTAAMILLASGCRQQQTTTGEPEPTVADTGAQSPAVMADNLTANLTGAEEVPGPGDEDGSGEAKVTLKDESQICYELEVKNIDPADNAHIHQGAKGVAGPVVVTLEPPASGKSEGCVDVEAALFELIKSQPEGFYVNVHNPAFKDGAVRGQLS